MGSPSSSAVPAAGGRLSGGGGGGGGSLSPRRRIGKQPISSVGMTTTSAAGGGSQQSGARGSKKRDSPPLGKTAWMNPVLRTWLSATRPWSVPASLVPIALTGTLLWRLEPTLLSKNNNPESATLLSPEFVLALLGGALVHLAANLVNTYCDFVRGVDTKEHADDRALVDQLVRPRDVLGMAAFCLLGAFSVLLYFLFLSPLALDASAWQQLVWIAGLGLVLAICYSADPVGLKYRGLGDLCVFLCFGPLLMAGASVCIAGGVPFSVLVFSVPIGLLTAAILHANNTRDVRADRAAGAVTLAMSLTFEQNFMVYVALLAGAFGSVFVASLLIFPTIGLRSAMVLVALPWATFAARKFRAKQLSELPQLTAQMELFFGAALICALADPLFFARVLLGCLFYLGGVNNILMWSYVTPMLSEDVGNLVGFRIPARVAQVLLFGAVVSQICAALLFMLGIYARVAAAVLIFFLVPVTLTVHDFWTVEDDSEDSARPVAARTIATFPTEFDNEFVHFFKNIGMLGGLVLFLECGCA